MLMSLFSFTGVGTMIASATGCSPIIIAVECTSGVLALPDLSFLGHGLTFQASVHRLQAELHRCELPLRRVDCFSQFGPNFFNKFGARSCIVLGCVVMPGAQLHGVTCL